jgi:putative FmdB family regulatory protein
MPLFDYKCAICGHVAEELIRTGDIPDEMPCDACGGKAKRIITPGKRRHAECRPFFSVSMGVAPEQIAEEKRLHPEREFNANGDLLVRNYQHQKQLARELGMEIR